MMGQKILRIQFLFNTLILLIIFILHCNNLNHNVSAEIVDSNVIDGNRADDTNCVFAYIVVNRKSGNCANKGFREVPVRTVTRSVYELNLDENKIQRLHSYSFSNWDDIVELSIQENSVKTITSDAFSPLKNLKILNLKANHIALLQSMPSVVFTHITQLEQLILSFNPLFHIPNFYFQPLSNLKVLNLTNVNGQNVVRLYRDSFAGLNSLELLDLSNNKLSRLPENNNQAAFVNMSLKYLYLGGDNPFICDCKLRWIRVWQMQRGTNNFQYIDELNRQPICHEPSNVAKQPLFGKDLIVNFFQCKPFSRSVPEKVRVYAKQNVTLSCYFYSDPKGSTTWLKDGTVVQKHWESTLGVSLNTTPGSEFVTMAFINGVTEKHAGVWECLTINRAGETRVNFTIELLPDPNPLPVTKLVLFGGIAIIGLIVSGAASLIILYYFHYRMINTYELKGGNDTEQKRLTDGNADIMTKIVGSLENSSISMTESDKKQHIIQQTSCSPSTSGGGKHLSSSKQSTGSSHPYRQDHGENCC